MQACSAVLYTCHSQVHPLFSSVCSVAAQKPHTLCVVYFQLYTLTKRNDEEAAKTMGRTFGSAFNSAALASLLPSSNINRFRCAWPNARPIVRAARLSAGRVSAGKQMPVFPGVTEESFQRMYPFGVCMCDKKKKL